MKTKWDFSFLFFHHFPDFILFSPFLRCGSSTAYVSSNEHKDDMRTLSALQQSLEDAAQFRGDSRETSEVGGINEV